MSKIAVVVPTIRAESFLEFMGNWAPLFDKHDVTLLTVWDGDVPKLEIDGERYDAEDVLGADSDLIYHRTDACRNLGFAYIAKHLPEIETIITLDDDVRIDPNHPDPIQEHLDVLRTRVPVTWLSSVGWGVPYMRGFPYGIRSESKVGVSHGVWTGVPDLDARTQQKHPEMTNFQGPFYVGPVPRGINIPLCGMNLAFDRAMLPVMYYAPMGPRVGFNRWADILLGMTLTETFSKTEWCIFSGASTIWHSRASNLEKNLEQEKDAIPLGESYNWVAHGIHPKHEKYVTEYLCARTRWAQWVRESEGALTIAA